MPMKLKRSAAACAACIMLLIGQAHASTERSFASISYAPSLDLDVHTDKTSVYAYTATYLQPDEETAFRVIYGDEEPVEDCINAFGIWYTDREGNNFFSISDGGVAFAAISDFEAIPFSSTISYTREMSDGFRASTVKNMAKLEYSYTHAGDKHEEFAARDLDFMTLEDARSLTLQFCRDLGLDAGLGKLHIEREYALTTEDQTAVFEAIRREEAAWYESHPEDYVPPEELNTTDGYYFRLSQRIDGIAVNTHMRSNRALPEGHPFISDGTYYDVVVDAGGIAELRGRAFEFERIGEAGEIISGEQARAIFEAHMAEQIMLIERTVVDFDLIYYPVCIGELEYELHPMWAFTLAWVEDDWDYKYFIQVDAYTGEIIDIR